MTKKAFNDLDYEEFSFRFRMLTDDKADTFKRELVAASFTAWQLKETKKTFDQYLKMFGLSENRAKMPDEVKKKLALKNISIAERIRKASIEQRENK